MIETKKISKSYKKTVVNSVDLSFKLGEIVGLLGPNGAGKTTTFYMMVGLIRPTQGDILLNDERITDLPMYKRAELGIGYLPQESSIFQGLNVENNILGVLELRDYDEAQRQEILEDLLTDFSLQHVRRSSALSLSGGERRRVEIARALAISPKYLFLDEPFAGIDPIAVNEIRQIIVKLKKRNIGILITDHNVRETLDIVDRAYIMYDSRVLTSGTPSEIIDNELVRKVYLGDRFRM